MYTFELEQAKITVRPQTGQDTIDLPFINLMIAKHVAPGIDIENIANRVYVRLMLFAQIVCQTVKVENVGFSVTSVYAPDEKIIEFYEILFTRPENAPLLQAWVDAIARVNRAPDEGKKKTEQPANS